MVAILCSYISPHIQIHCPVEGCSTVCDPATKNSEYTFNITSIVHHAFKKHRVVLRVSFRLDAWSLDNIPIDEPYSRSAFHKCIECDAIVEENSRLDHATTHDDYKRFTCPEAFCHEEFHSSIQARLHVHDTHSWGDSRINDKFNVRNLVKPGDAGMLLP
jgi:hypothetical protein